MNDTKASFDRLFGIIRRLRAPDGCPWDREQTPLSLRAALIEETYECVEAINSIKTEGPDHVAEELGDVFLMVTMLSYIYEQESVFSVSQVLEGISEKLIRRHPHIFGNATADTSDEVLKQWNDIKVHVEGRKPKDSVLDEVSKALPPLERAYKIQKKASKTGFDWQHADDVWAKTFEELSEAKEACTNADHDSLEDELGDLLFSVVNVARFLHVDPAVALHRTTSKFERRFRHVETRMKAENIAMNADSFKRMDELWDEAKAQEKPESKQQI